MNILTAARNLTRRKARERERLFVAEGVRTVEELLRSALVVRGVLTSPALDENDRGRALRDRIAADGIPVADVTERDFASAADTDSPQGILAIAEVPSRQLDDLAAIPAPTRLLILDGVQDPGNTGSMIRTSAALGANATVALSGTVDVWSAKVVRSAMGAHFHFPAFHATWPALEAFLARTETRLWIADVDGDPVTTLDGVPARLAVAVGNEGHGVSRDLRVAADRAVGLPIAPDIDSLNVAVAAGILLFALRP
ncbi:MAG TPA: RNA methyltransferase [Gemmatimonadaceae bacterium]|nr:RNA methyltransferase [Gemmatimonadaceae bacterium]